MGVDVHDRRRVHVTVTGAVQGVGFRPTVYRLATELGLAGWVNNSADGVHLEVEGAAAAVEEFLGALASKPPPNARIVEIRHEEQAPEGSDQFEIQLSQSGALTAHILPDLATCPACLADLRDAANRRYRYPFTNCTDCGPRFSIVRRLPYDRPYTSMAGFPLCPDCQGEYDDPLDRRFHAQPNACPVCGPQLAVWDGDGKVLAERDEALATTVTALRNGAIVAVKGLGGFHLVCRADDKNAVSELRRRKHREEKPFAVMAPDLDTARRCCRLSDADVDLLTSQAAPIVLARKRDGYDSLICDAVAPGNPNLGVMLPYTPLHHLLLEELGLVIVATSGNLSDEPICTDEHEALVRLAGIADLFLVHDRPIVRPVDDSVARVLAGEPQVLRRSRGYAPLPLTLPREVGPTLAVGAHMKNTVAMAHGREVFLSQHVGDLETEPALHAFRAAIDNLHGLYDRQPDAVVSDLHPDYVSTRHAESLDIPRVAVQHHAAHIYAVMAEHGWQPPVLGISWDGTGLGPDGVIWGGEMIRVHETGWKRVGHLRPFRLPGGDVAVREPRRIALALLWELFDGEIRQAAAHYLPRVFTPSVESGLIRMLEGVINSPLTTSAGRLFDGVAGLLRLRDTIAYEGQAAMTLEWTAGDATAEAYPMAFVESPTNGAWILDWEPMLRQILADLDENRPKPEIAAAFHQTLAEAIRTVVRRESAERVALGGGCFQNRRLSETTIDLLRADGVEVAWGRQVPPNDACISLGQVMAYAMQGR